MNVMKKTLQNMSLGIKRGADVIGSGLGLIVLSPLLVLIALMIKIFMPGPIFFKQERVGKSEKIFFILKFRSMKVDKVAEESHDFTKDESRMTSLGKLLRRTKIDEIPQLINVVKGDMSLVGPRPTVKEQVDQYTDYQRHRLDMRPGMTGLAQVNGNVALSWEERIEYDLKYVNNFSLLLDLRILIKTVLVVIFGEQRFKNPVKRGVK